MSTEWGYLKSNGPATWVNIAPAAKGKRQSPIDIIPSQANYDKNLTDNPLRMSYDASKAKTVINNGHSIQVTYDSAGSSLEGGPLSNKYQLAQFHFHWGKSNVTGSEHRIDGQMYAAEAHLVHYNTDVYKTFGDAAQAENGLCVLGVFLKPGHTHSGLKRLTDLLGQLKYKGSEVAMKGGFDPACLLPGDTERYWTYPGSLTTPPCFESVTWVVFKEPIEVSDDQLNVLRNLVGFTSGSKVPDDEFKGHIVENYRPPLALDGRVLRSSFQ